VTATDNAERVADAHVLLDVARHLETQADGAPPAVAAACQRRAQLYRSATSLDIHQRSNLLVAAAEHPNWKPENLQPVFARTAVAPSSVTGPDGELTVWLIGELGVANLEDLRQQIEAASNPSSTVRPVLEARIC
jgi:hypothetical protein